MSKIFKAVKGPAKKMINQMVKQNVSPQQYQALVTATSVVKKSRKKRQNKAQSSHSNVPLNISSTVTNTFKTEVEKYRWTVMTGATAPAGYVRFYHTPLDVLQLNSASGEWDPKLGADSAKFREFRIKSGKFIYNGGLPSTISGTIFYASTKTPTTERPTTADFSYMEKNMKSTVTQPANFPLLFDNEWHPINRSASVLDETAISINYAGVSDLSWSINSSNVADYSGLKVDLELTIEYRGRNPNFDIADTDFVLERGSAALTIEDLPISAFPLRSQTLTSTLRSYKLRAGPCLVINHSTSSSASNGDFVTIRSKAGVDVTNARMLANQYSVYNHSGSGGGTELECPQGTFVVGIATPASHTIQHYFGFFLEGDYVEVIRAVASSTALADSRFQWTQLQRMSQARMVAFVRLFNPNFNENSLPII